MRELNLETLMLERGNHPPDSRYCVMEAVAYMAGEPWSDHPACASRVIAAFLRTWNDGLDDAARQSLKRYIPRLLHSAATPAVEDARAWVALDWLIRVYTPTWLRGAGLVAEAARLEELEPIQTTADLLTAQPRLDATRDRAAAARDAAWDAARDAAWAVARDAAWDAARAAAWAVARAAAWDAARDAARAVARDAAWDAARDAARDAAWDAARDALNPTVRTLQASAHDLVERMLAMTEETRAA